MIYFDGIHLSSPDLDQLHEFAQSIGMKRAWFQDHERHPHYDAFGKMADLAMNFGAEYVSSKELIRKCFNTEIN